MFRQVLATTDRSARKLRRLLRGPGVHSRPENFQTSGQYWRDRYADGGNSGRGSYGPSADYKAQFLREFLRGAAVGSTFELGCGDGHQASRVDYVDYTGVDVSPVIVAHCRNTLSRRGYRFAVWDDFVAHSENRQFDLGLSLDVLYHIIEEEVFCEYLDVLFDRALRHVLVYSTDCDAYDPAAPHIRHRTFTRYVADRQPAWKLAAVHDNPLHAGRPQGGSVVRFHHFTRDDANAGC